MSGAVRIYALQEQNLEKKANSSQCDASLAAKGFARAGLLHWHALNHTGKAYGLLTQAAATDPTGRGAAPTRRVGRARCRTR